MSQSISRSTSSSTALVPQKSQSLFPSKAVYIRLLGEEECRRPDVIALIQNSKYEIDEIYGIFDQKGEFIGAGSERETAAESAADSGFQPQLRLM
jgi:hypothetical protein